MAKTPTIKRVDRTGEWAQRYRDSEKQLFRHYDLSPVEHTIRLKDPDLRLRALEQGTGPPLILVPGGNGEAVSYVRLMRELQGWRVITFDRPGGGMSDAVNHLEVDLRQLAVQILGAVFDHFHLENVPVVANSMGGLWTFWFALDRSARINRIVQLGCPALLLGTSAPLFNRLLSVPGLNRMLLPLMQPDGPEEARDGLLRMGSPEATLREIPDIMAETVCLEFNSPQYPLAWLSLMRAALRLWGANTKYRLDEKALGRITQPTLFVWGEKDPFGGVETGRQAIEILPDAQIIELDAGHLPFIDAPEFCAHQIREFLSG
ncbi:MAG: alpha/beta hydrolase [Candidatus Marinimicrobia bacterium]|nr:alpha/beta hydrolase [Candidatus Neomarinimicrobiota bacterium]MCF7827938.1 alpha/beta hydrolase [Candidatus Neomarinimicrobiota bacterium]MCF7879307.1 alpha/beta hydrolase [Candidatus Neomarinimicrobiota bacterium]